MQENFKEEIMLSAEGTGKNIEKAIENALLELKASREDVDIKIISEGGLFKKAKVVVSISQDMIEKYENKAQKRKAIIEEEMKEKSKQEVQEIPETQTQEIVEDEEVEEKIEEKVRERKPKQDKILDPLQFLKGLFESAGKNVEISVQEDGDYITYVVEGEELSDMIGHRGETFYAISRLLQTVAGKTDKKLLLDIGGYREKRKESLTALAYRMANKVAQSGRYARLDPMNPADRRIIHTALQNDKRVSTLSKGTEPHRYVMIFPQGEE